MTDNLRKLYDTLSSRGLVDTSYNDFVKNYEDESYKKEIFDLVSNEELYSKDFNSFSTQYALPEIEEPKEEKTDKVEDEVVYESDIDMQSFFSQDSKTQAEKDFKYFDKDFNKISDELGSVWLGGKGFEETIVPELNKKFSKWGFTFEQSDAFGDEVTVRSTTDPNLVETFDLDDANTGMASLKKYLDKNKRGSAVYAEEVTDISIDDKEVQDLLKATAEEDEEKKNALLTGISRKIYASNGINYDELKLLENKSEKNQDEIDFLLNNVLVKQDQKDKTFEDVLGGIGASVGAVDQRIIKDYEPTEEEINKYPEIFNQDGSLKVDPNEYINKLKSENSKISDITTSDLVYKTKIKESLLFKKFKNKETAKILETNNQINNKVSELSNDFKELTGFDISQSGKVNEIIERNLESYNNELKQIANITFDDLATYEPKTTEEALMIQDVVDRYNNYYNSYLSEINSIYGAYQVVGEESRNINLVGNTINSMLQFDDLYKYRGQYEDSSFKSVINNVRLGWSQGEVNEEFLKVAYGISDPNDEEEVGRIAKNVAEEMSFQKGLLTSETWEKYQSATTVAEQLKILGTNPAEVLLSLFGNSMSMFASTGKNIFIPVVGGAAGVGAGVGAGAGGVGAVPGAITGFGWGLTAWQTITGFNMELGSAYSEELTKAGYDLTDADQVVAGLRNNDVVAAANKRGLERGIPIAVVNFVGSRVAGSLVNPLATTGKQVAQQFATGLAVEPLFEGAGELTAQMLSDGQIVGTEILNEMIGGAPGTQSNIAVQYAQNQFLNTQTKLANQLQDINYMAQNNYGYDQVRAFTNRLLKKGKITQDQANVIVKNANSVDAANAAMRKGPKFLSNKRRSSVRDRISQLIQTKKIAEEVGNNDLVKKIDKEIEQTATSGRVITDSKIITASDYLNVIKNNLIAGSRFINKKLDAETVEVVNVNEENLKNIKQENNELYNEIKNDINNDSPGFVTKEINGKRYIVLNDSAISAAYSSALQSGELTGASVLSHEILHLVLDSTFDEQETIKLGEELEGYITDENNTAISSGARQRISNKLNKYQKLLESGEYTLRDYYQEVFTVLSDEMQADNIEYGRQDKSFWQRMADSINDLIYKNRNVFDDVTRKNLKINGPEDAFNFVKDYSRIFTEQKRAKKGKLRVKAPVIEDKVRKSIISKGEQMNDFINPGMTKAQFQSERTVEVNGRMMTPFDAAYAAVNGPVFERLIGAKVVDTKGKNREDFIQEVKDYLSDLLVTFDPQQNDNLFAWVNSQVSNKIGTVSKKIKAPTKSIDKKEGETGRTIAETIAQEDTDIESRSIEEAKEVFTLEDKIDLSEETNASITNEVEKINFTKLPDPYEEISKNKTVTPFVSELKQSIGKTASGALSQASRAIIVQMGKRGEYVPYLRNNLPFIIKKLPIGYLAKNMPNIVMKSVDGKFTLDWQGKTIDKYTMAETGMTSQPQKMKLKPDITKEDIDVIISKFAKPTGSPIQAKQEGLAYQIASELGLEKFANDLQEEGNISEKFNAAQEILGREEKDNIVSKISADIERGIKGVRYSVLANPAAQVALSISIPQIAKNIANVSMTEVDAKKYIRETLKGVVNSILPDYGLSLENKDITSIVNKIITYRRRAMSALDVQTRGKQKRIDVENEIIESTLQFQENVVSHLGLNESVKSLFQNSRNINDSRRSYLDQYRQEIKNGRDPLEVIIDVLKWEVSHLDSSSKIGDGGFELTNEVNDLGQRTVVRVEGYPSDKTNRAQVFKNKRDSIENLANLISDKYDVRVTESGKLDGVYEAGTNNKIDIDTTTPAQKSKSVLDAIDAKVKEGLSLQEAKRRVFKERENAAKEAQRRIIARMEYLKNKNDKVLTAMTMASFKSNMNAILRAAANAKYLANVDLRNSGKIVYEHLIPAEIVAMSLLQAYFPKGSLKINVKELFDAYSVALIPESMDNVLKKFGFQQMMSPSFLQDLSKFLERYYNDLTFGSEIYAITDMSNDEVIGQEWQDAYEINNQPATISSNRKSLMSSDIMPDNVDNTYMVQAAENMTNALNNSLNDKAPVKKIRVFDFDDTLAQTKSLVFYNKPNETNQVKPRLKAIVMAGPPGGGKSSIVKGLGLVEDGFKEVNQDISLEWLKTKEGLPAQESDYTKEQKSMRSKLGAEARKIAARKLDKFANQGDGIILDGTGASVAATEAKIQALEELGYEVSMVYVNTPKETAVARNKARKERSLPNFIVERTWDAVNENREIYAGRFGDKFYEINTEGLKQGEIPSDVSSAIRSGLSATERGRLTAEEFAQEGKKLVDEGFVMDFSDFNIVREGTRGPLFEVAQKIKEARGNEDLFVLTARAPESRDAIYEFLKAEGLEFKRENIVGLGNSTGEAKAQWLVSKAAEGFNDFYFADDALANVEAVKQALEPLDIKSKVQQAKVRYSILSNEFNNIVEKTTGVEAFKEYSAAKAKTIGASKGKFKFWIPYSAEDFMGLIYPLLSKGAEGDKQMAWFKQNLMSPYARAMEAVAKARINLMQDFKALKDRLKVPALLKDKNKSGFTNEQSVRIYMWDKQGMEVPGISKTDLKEAIDIVEKSPKLKLFADEILKILKGDEYIKPDKNWLSGTITTDLIQTLKETKRKKYLEEWNKNIDAIFSEANLNKLEAIYGSKYREALENIISRMKSGSNRLSSGSRLSNQMLDYINASNGAIMFFNMRSAVLQTISAINFINWSFNNPYKAGKAFANQPQYWKDFSKLMNSDYLVDRRGGQRIDINESEIANAASTSKNKAKAAINYILKKGYLPTQFADSFAIALGGATWYRNRINDLVSQGMNLSDAEKQAMTEFTQIAEEAQQSSNPSKISQQQASDAGRLILMFANTPMQYARLTKRAYQDLINGRGDAKSNISKIIYYTFVQNMIFNALQQALFAIGFGEDDEDDEKREESYYKVANGMLDSQLRGLGFGGVAISVIKNFLMDIYERSGRKRPEYVDSVWKLMQFSPPISSKISKIRQAAWQFDSKARREEMYEEGFSLNNPAYEALAKVVSATANIPLDRLYDKAENIEAALSDESDWWQKVAMLSGWPEWQIMDKSTQTKKGKKRKPKLKKKKVIL